MVDELPDRFVLRLRERNSKKEKPDALLIGEVWEDASNKIAYGVRRRYFTDRELDSVINYPWQKEILRFVRGDADGADLGERIMTLAENYPADVLACVMNVLSTHDTPRAINALLDPQRRRTRRACKAAVFRCGAFARQGALRMAAFLQFTLPGIACVYYGDEAGMTGYRDPFNRKYYPWGQEDEPAGILPDACEAEKTLPALRRGDVVTVMEAGGGRLMFRRSCEAQTLCVCCNQSDAPWEFAGAGEPLLGGRLCRFCRGESGWMRADTAW